MVGAGVGAGVAPGDEPGVGMGVDSGVDTGRLYTMPGSGKRAPAQCGGSSARLAIAGIGLGFVGIVQRHAGQSTSLVADQEFDPFLGVVQQGVPVAGQTDTLFVHGEGLLQAEIARFELSNDLSQTIEDFIETDRFDPLSLGVRHTAMVGAKTRCGQ